MKLLLENQILPPVSVMIEIVRAETVIIEKYDTFQKRTYRNRFVIATPKGRHLISIPLKKGKTRMLFTDVEISYHDLWITTLSNNLKSNYNSSPFFDHYYYPLINIFQSKFKYLFDLNNELRNFMFNSMGIEKKVFFTSEYGRFYEGDIIDSRDYYSPTIERCKKELLQPYNQVFEDKTGFLNDLSCIDLLFNTGKFAPEYLKYQPSK